jgi:coenzyme PQQ biosynthesis protein PqqD
MDDSSIPKHVSNLDIVEMSDGIVVQCGDLIHTLNETAREIFELCDGHRSVPDIIAEMKSRYNEEKIDTVIKDFISSLQKLNLIQM